MDKKIQESQGGCGPCSILELQNKYYSINPHNSERRIFWSQLQGMQLVIHLLDLGHINIKMMDPLIAIIQELDIRFMWHSKERLPEERVFFEENERAWVLCAMRVRINKAPEIGTVNNPSGKQEAYILGVDYQSESFSTLEEGIEEAHILYHEKKIKGQELEEILRKIGKFFPDSDFPYDERYQFGIN